MSTPSRRPSLPFIGFLGARFARNRTRRWGWPSLFALIALCFLLPFATVSCDKARTTFTGVQLVTHTVPRGGTLDEGADCSTDISVCVERDAATTATIAFAAALIGLVLGALGTTRGPGWCAATGLGAMLVLAGKAIATFAHCTLRVGYWLALLLLLFASVSALRGWRQRRRARAGDVGPPDVVGQPGDFVEHPPRRG